MASSDTHARIERIVEAHAEALLAYFMRRVEQPEDAADLLGDTLLVLWRKPESVPTDETEARMWMFGVARRVLSTQQRGRQRRDALVDRLRSQLAVDDGAGDPVHIDLRYALDQLEPVDQEIIRLVHWDGFTQAQAASLLDLPEGTVRSRHYRARQRLRWILDGSQI
jgi:RNA polymerase sigma-70 factor (ECF subfamily)